MQNSTKVPKDDVISVLKEWASPFLIGIVGMLLWRDVTEMRADIKLLLTQQSADRVKIEQLEADVTMLKNHVFTKTTPKPVSKNSRVPDNNSKTFLAILHKEEDFKPVPEKQRK